MKKLVLIAGLIAIISLSSLYGIFERLGNFLHGRRYYYYYDNDVYYDAYGRRHYTYYTWPRSVYYYGPRYVYAEKEGASYAAHNIAIKEDENKIIVSVSLPGYDKKDIALTASERSIHIEARPTQDEISGIRLLPFDQTIPLDAYIKPEEVTSVYENGIVTITLPRQGSIAPVKGVAVPIK